MLYKYITIHGLGGSCPTDLKEFKCLPDGKTELYFERPLTAKELNFYDIKDEWEV